jgi:hypothetical protein
LLIHEAVVPRKWSSQIIEDGASIARNVLARIEKIDPSDIEDLDDDETRECWILFRRMLSFFGRFAPKQEIGVKPRFAGCGLIDACFGDILIRDILFEVKAGERSFRSVDVRQLLTYAALNKASRGKRVERLGLFNLRTGVSFDMNIDDLCLEVAGCPSEELLGEIIRVISSGDISR